MTDFQDRLQTALAAEFTIERELGGAGMSRVFVATERALNRTVVVKVLPPELAAGVNVERFRREIQLAAQLQHPHIVPLLAAGDSHGLLWFSMPYIDGESLRGALARRGRLAPRDVVRILHDVVDALAYAHARGVVHRDIKPDNILTSGMHALVTDFGVAKALSAATPTNGGTATGTAIGTPAYMAPEQLAADPAMDHRVDLYAVGLLAYELLTGTSPFVGPSPQATLAAQLTVMPKPPHGSFSDIPEPLSLLIMHCLEKDAARRPPTAQALLAELEALPPMSSSTSVARRARRRSPVVLAAGALGVAALAWALSTRTWRDVRQATPGVDSLDARDTGPGGAARPMEIATGNTTGVRPPAETTPVFREITDGAPSTAVPFVITRAESLAIAEAVRKRQAAARSTQAAVPAATETRSRVAATPAPTTGTRIFIRTADGATTEIARDLLLAELGQIFADSMSRALQHMDSALARAPRTARVDLPRPAQMITPLLAPPNDARLRIVVTNYTNTTGKREFGGAAREVAHVMRGAIAVDRFDVVSDELTDRAVRSLPDRMAAGWALRADYVVSGMLMVRGDSLAVVTMLTDVRFGRFSKAAETAVPLTEPSRAFEPAKQQVAAWLDTAAMLAARRRSPRPPTSLDGRRW